MHKLFFDAALTPSGWREDVAIEIENGVFRTVSAGADRQAPFAIRGGIAVPGLANLHSHTFQRGFAGLTERRGTGEDHFWTWRETMYDLSARLLPEDVEAIAALAFAEMLEGGFTGVAEFHYLHHAPDGRPYDDPSELGQRVAAAAAHTGIGLTLLPVFYAHAGFGGLAPAPGQRRFVSSLDLYGRLVEGARRAVATFPAGRVGIAPHSLRAATGDEITSLLAAFPDGPVHIHIAEQTREVEDCIAATGARPVEWLLDNAAVDARWCLIHATHMTVDETVRMAETGAVAGLCPITESDLGDGIFPATDYRAAGGLFGVGSDSNVLISAAVELRTLEYSQRLRDRSRNRLAPPSGGSTGRGLFEAAKMGGARALGQAEGAIAPGCRADIVVLDGTVPSLYGRHGDDVLDSWLFAAAHSPVDRVYAAGRLVVEDGRHRARDRIEVAYRNAMLRLSR